MDLSTIIPIVLGSSITTVIITQAFNYFSNRNKLKNINKFIGLSLAKDLELYSWRCGIALSDHTMWEDTSGSCGRQITELPNVFKLPNEDYKFFDLLILDKVYAFPLKLESADRAAQFFFEVAGRDEAYEKIFNECNELGAEALELATEIRNKYKLLIRPIKFGRITLQELYSKHKK